MLNVQNPSPQRPGVAHRFALGENSIQPAYDDPNHTRAELMEVKQAEKPCCSPMLSLLSAPSF